MSFGLSGIRLMCRVGSIDTLFVVLPVHLGS
jgi:hypothetical protein